ncbi:MAG: hypothetical protein OWU33_12550 [Firmicutes bacterium]|nr:hypothetical protein [Bacillota bacterium]
MAKAAYQLFTNPRVSGDLAARRASTVQRVAEQSVVLAVQKTHHRKAV